MPSPLDARMSGPTSNGRYVTPARDYLVSFVWMEPSATGVSEVHVMPRDGDPVGFIRNLGAHVIPRVADL